MPETPQSPAHTDYVTWLNQDPEPGWYDPGEGHRIQTAFLAGWRAGIAHVADRIELAPAEDKYLGRLIEDLKAGIPEGPLCLESSQS